MFSILNLQINRGLTSANAQGKNTAVIHTYIDLNSTIATIRLYLPPDLNQGSDQRVILVNDYMLVGGSDTTIFSQILSLDPFTLGIDLFSGASGLSIGPPIVATDNNGAIITGQILQLENADSTHNGIVTRVAQEFGGHKTFRDDVTIIPGADFVVAGPSIEELLIKTQATTGGVQIQTDNSANIMAYAFGSVGLGANFAGLAFSETGFGMPFAPGMFLALGNFPAVGIDNAGNTIVTLILKVDTIDELAPGNGTTINGNNIKPNNITFSNSDVFWNTETVVGTTRFSFDANDYLSYDKLTNALDVAIGSTVVTKIDGTNGIQTDIGFDRISAGQLDIGLNNATTIFLAKPVSIFGGATLLVDNIDTATPATPLSLGATNASVINLDENTVIANTKTLHTNTLDSTTVGALTLGSTNSTAITLDEDSTVSAGKLFKANSVDSATAVPLVLGDTTATAITLDKDTTVTAGQIFHANSMDAATAVPLVIGDTTATAITLDKDTTITAGQLFKANSIDSATAVPLVIADTTATAITLDKDTTVTAGQLFKANSVDAATATTLIIGDTTATAITLDKSTTVTSGSVLNTNTLDATTAGTLSIGTTTATAITLAKNTTVSSGQVLNTNTLDATTAGTLSIGTTTATAITLAKSTTVTSGQLFKANSVDAATATALILGDTTATAITLDKDTTVTVGQLFKANSVDAASAVPIVIGDTTATAITLDKNTTVTTGSTLTADSITLLTSGGTPTALNYYEESSFTTQFTLNAITTMFLTVNVIRVGRNVTVRMPTGITTAPQAVTGVAYVASQALATRFRPTTNVYGWTRVSNVGSKTGMIQVGTDGIIRLFNEPDGTTVYTVLTGNGFDSFSITYTLQ